ncbi:uncharacterized protein BDZ99DRAFT_576251 [Mytilinidion resinicola]|uniref:NUDE domain-containing protein n=1 Tax=Mytilinidion resinicola TaxID=574789 RepID=A0A6A6Y3Y1_9PEZI|nr:uncharacterized protein BDZ99DRAFT_576251 [Mytilinidion resinicola]KAF2803360.1 hypothetical protein BDZ99DRAFT_576251 [Mytilinidion resinicola]
MPSVGEPPSSPPPGGWNSVDEELRYYKAQYETLESELQEFQNSSKELEAELERDIEESEKRERQLQEKVESLGFEVNEWQTKYKQSKTEANNAQNTLQKEITTLRESQRALQLRLRDIEVANDDFERQARNTTSSLEDLESKYNVAIERSVMLDEEMRIGDQEREGLRIENQRIRDELSDLRIEAEIVQEKLRLAEQTIQSHHERKTSHHLLSTDKLRPRSPVSETSTSATTLSSPTASTPPPKSDTSVAESTPPSPPISEASVQSKKIPATPLPTRKRSLAPMDSAATPRPGFYSSRPPRHSRGPSIPVSATPSNGRSTPSIRRTGAPPSTAPRPSVGTNGGGLPRSGSLYQIRGLIGKMQKLEERVHSARSKLPAPTYSPPRASPRNASPRTNSALGQNIPSTVTVRSSRKRPSQASAASSVADGTSSVSRLSFGIPTREGGGSSRPSSRASVTSGLQPRPSSRSSMSGARTPLGHYASSSISGVDGRIAPPRPRSSMSGTYAHSHGHSQSLSMASSVMRESSEDAGSDGSAGLRTPMPRRTSTAGAGSAIPTPSGLPRRQSAGRRISAGGEGEMGPPERPPLGVGRSRKLSDLGETY